jgi:hypothetical protein
MHHKRMTNCNAFHILSIQETKIDRTFPNSQFHVAGYKAKGGGDIAVFILDNIIAARKKPQEKLLNPSSSNYAYKPPSVDNTTFTKELTTILDEATRNCDNLICLADLNCDILDTLNNNEQGKCLLDICDIYDVDSLIKSPLL